MTPFDRHNISHLSASSLNLFVAMPSLWCASYLLKRRTGVGPAAHRGTAIECGVEAGLFDPQMPVAEAQKLAEAKFHTLTRFSADARIEKERELVAPSVEVALAELRQYGVPEKPENGRQHKIEVELGNGLPPAFGYLDFWWPQHGGRTHQGGLVTKGAMYRVDQVSVVHCGCKVVHVEGFPFGLLRRFKPLRKADTSFTALIKRRRPVSHKEPVS